MPLFKVWDLDVWGGPDDYTVNDRREKGTVEIPATASEKTIKKIAFEENLITSTAVLIDIPDEDTIHINGTDGMPYYTLEKVA